MQRELQCRRAGVDRDAVPAVDQRGELLLERGDLGALHDHAAAQHADGGLDLGFADHRLGRRNRVEPRVLHV